MKTGYVADILKEFTNIGEAFQVSFDPEPVNAFIKAYENDSRKGVLQLVRRAGKLITDFESELKRIDHMLRYERSLDDCRFIGGIDEAGRGPLAGPVVAACVILNPDDPIHYVNDSKKLNEKTREKLYDEIINRSVAYGIGVIGEKDIDELNILQATYKAMRSAIGQMDKMPDHLLNDAVIVPEVDIPQEKIIKGDANSLSIAAASILAKVTRDRLMVAYDELYPEYGFAQHKGYGSKEHIAAIVKHGPSPIHRKTFIKNFTCKIQ